METGLWRFYFYSSYFVTGLSVFSERDAMPDCLKDKPLWQLDIDTPFPEELGIHYENQRHHGLISPTRPVKVHTLEKVSIVHVRLYWNFEEPTPRWRTRN